MNPTETIRRGRRVEEFLQDEAIVWALDELRQENYRRFVTAQTTDDLRAAQARQQAFDAFAQTLRAIVDAGMVEQHHREHEQNTTDSR